MAGLRLGWTAEVVKTPLSKNRVRPSLRLEPTTSRLMGKPIRRAT